MVVLMVLMGVLMGVMADAPVDDVFEHVDAPWDVAEAVPVWNYSYRIYMRQ